MANNGDLELIATLDESSSEAEILRVVKILQGRLKTNANAKIKLDSDIDTKQIEQTLEKLEKLMSSKKLSLNTQNSIKSIQKEAEAMLGVVSSANMAAKEKLEFANANRRVADSANNTARAIENERNSMQSLDNIDYILQNINAQGQAGNSVFQQFGNTLRDAFYAFSAANLLQDAIYKVINAGKEGLDTVKELNDAAVSLRMATGNSYDSVKSMIGTYNDMAQELGALTVGVSESADEWLRQGHNVRDTNELITDSMILSKVSNLESAESTKYLTSAMQGYKVAVEDVIGIVDKLSSVDLESATDAGGLAEAMSRTAEGANIAGLEMDRLIAMIATVGEVTQKSMSSIGESYKTIFSRMRDIKDNKLSVVGDDGEIEDLSNVEIVLNELGIKLRDSNLEFRNFQNVLDDVADSWNSYSSVQKAAIAKSFAGVRQQENFLVMMENWDKVIEYTNVAANSSGTATEKFGYYLEGLEAKTNSLKASLENLASTTISDELYESVLDTSKAIVDTTAETGLLKGALAGIGTAGAIFAFQHLATFLRDATQGFANLNEAMNLTRNGSVAINDMQRLIDLTGGLSNSQLRLVLSTNNLTDAQKISILMSRNMTQAEAEHTLQTWRLASAQYGATNASITLGGALRGLWSTLIANPLILVTAGVTAGVMAWNKYKQSIEETRQKAEEAANTYKESASSINDYISKYKELQNALVEAKGNEEATYDVKKQLLDLQTELNDKYGDEFGKINLVTSAYKDQTQAIEELNKKTAEKFLNENQSGINRAKAKMTEENTYMLADATGKTANSGELINIAEKYKDKGVKVLDQNEYFSIYIETDAKDAYDIISSFENDVREKAKELGDENLFSNVLNVSSSSLNDAKEIIDKYQETYEQSQLASIATDDNLSRTYNNAVSAVNNYNEAVLKSENPYDDENVKKAYDNLQIVKQGIKDNEEEWGQYSNITDNVFSSANDSVYSFYNAITNDKSISKLTDGLKGLYDIDLQSMADDENNGDAFDKLCEKANAYGLEVQDVIDLLIQLGIVQSKIAEQTMPDTASDVKKSMSDVVKTITDDTELSNKLFKLASTGELTGSKLKSLAESNELLKSAMDSSGLSADKLAEKIRELNIDNIESDIKSFADALDKVKNKQSLTAEETSKLILADNSLAGSVKKTKDGYLIEKDALSKVIDTQKEKYNVAVSYEINETKKVIDKIKDRIDAYKKEIKALELVNKARNDEYSKAVESGYDEQDASRAIFGNSQAVSDSTKYADISKKKNKDEKSLDKKLKKLKELESSLNNIDTSSSSKSSGSNSKSSKIFDYIQIKISRLERLHSKYLDKASDGTKTLTERTKNYNKVLSITDKQINAQDKAIARYNKQLKKIGLDESIAKKIRNGAFDIDTLKGKKKDKAEKYQDIYEKKLDAQDKKYDLKTGKSETERNKYQAELDALENKRKAEESISDELKNQIELKERIGDKNTSSDYSAVNESILKQINNYKKQIPILEKQLGTVKKGSDKWYEYKEAIDSVKDSISGLTQEMMDNATKGIEAIQNASDEYLKSLDDEDALNNAKKENALTADEKNGYIQNTINNIAKRKTKYAQDSLSYLNEKNNSVNLINATSKKVQKSEGSVFATISSLVNSGQKIPEDILKQVKDANLLINCYAYNSAITAYETNEATRKLYDETSKTDIRNAVIDKGNVIKDEYDNKSAALSRDEAKIEARIKENEAKGIGQSSNDYREQIAQSQERQQNYMAEKQRLEELLNQELALGHIIADENDPAYKFLMDRISECDTEISNCIVSQTNYNKAIKEMNVENYKTAISLLDSMIQKYKRLQSLADVHNSKLSDKDILAQIGLNDEKIAENNKYLSIIKDNIRTYLTDELHMSAENVEEFINLMENSPHKLRGFMNDLGFKNFNEKTFHDLINNINEFNSTMNENTALMVDQENQLDSLAQKRIDTLNEYLEALKKQKDYKDRIFAIEKAQYDLEKAKNNLTKKVWDGQQWVYTADTEAVQSAQESLDNAKFEEFNNSIQDLIEVLEQFIKDFNIYDDNGNMINNPEVILKKDVLGEYTIADIDKIFTDKVLDTSKLSGLMSNIQYAIPNVSIPNINLPDIKRNTGGVHNHYDNIELVLPNITDASTGAELAKSFVNELKNLPSYAKQYDWNR